MPIKICLPYPNSLGNSYFFLIFSKQLLFSPPISNQQLTSHQLTNFFNPPLSNPQLTGHQPLVPQQLLGSSPVERRNRTSRISVRASFIASPNYNNVSVLYCSEKASAENCIRRLILDFVALNVEVALGFDAK